MKRWVMFVEFQDNGLDPKFAMDEEYVRAVMERLGKELPPSITMKIRGLTGPFAEYGKAAGAK